MLSDSNVAVSALFGRGRRTILSLLFGRSDEAFYLRQIVRATGIGLGPAQRELKHLADAGIIRRTARGGRVYFQADPETPIFAELNRMAGTMEQVMRSIDPPPPASLPLSGRFPVPQELLAAFCRKHHIKKLSLFGSVLREDFRLDSDIDVLVEFEEGSVPGWDMVDVEAELSQLVGRKVDLRTPHELSRYFRERVVREAEVRYVAA